MREEARSGERGMPKALQAAKATTAASTSGGSHARILRLGRANMKVI